MKAKEIIQFFFIKKQVIFSKCFHIFVKVKIKVFALWEKNVSYIFSFIHDLDSCLSKFYYIYWSWVWVSKSTNPIQYEKIEEQFIGILKLSKNYYYYIYKKSHFDNSPSLETKKRKNTFSSIGKNKRNNTIIFLSRNKVVSRNVFIFS